MAYDATAPSFGAADWATALATIRENFRAIVAGDAGVFSLATDFQLQATTTGTSTYSRLTTRAGNGTTSSRNAYVRVETLETSPQAWHFGMLGDKNFGIRDNTAAVTRVIIDTTGKVGIGAAPFSKLCNTASNILDAGGIGTCTDGIVWDVNQASGYVLSISQAATAANGNGLLVKTASTNVGSRVASFESNGVVRLRVIADGNISFGGASSFGAGVGVISVTNAGTNPSSNPTGGGILYADAGAGKWRGSSGTVTTFGPAEPHCTSCGSDFVHEWESAKYGHLIACRLCGWDTYTPPRSRGAISNWSLVAARFGLA